MKNGAFAVSAVRKFLALSTIVFISLAQPTFAALLVNNGNFNDLSGLTSDGDWNHGVPNSWITLGGTNYVIYNTGTLLNLDHAGTISQSLGTVDVGGEDITVSFDYGDMWNGGYYAADEDMIAAEIFDATANISLATKTVKNTGLFGSLVSNSISATATAGNVIEIRFTSLPGNGITPGSAAALDNVSVRETTLPTLAAISSSDTLDGTYLTAAVIDLDLTFSEPVSSTGFTLNLDGGGTCTVAAFSASTTATCDYTVGTTENSSDLTVTSVIGTITDGAMNNTINPVPVSNLAAVKDIIVYNAVPPVLTEVTPVATPTYDTTPAYTFNASEAGTITYAGDCTSVTTSAVAGANTITFDTLALGVHSNCTVTVTDVDTMADTLNVPSFKIIPLPNTVVVNSTTAGWAHNDDGSATPGTGSFAPAPTPPLGSGAFQMTLANSTTSAYYLGTTLHNSTPIADITKLSYSTYRVSGDAAVAPTLQINIDADSTDGNTGWQGRLIYEPYHTQTVSAGVWQNWNALDDAAGTGTGNWWFSNGGLAASTTCTMANPCTWSEIKTKIPNGAVQGALGAIGFKAGTGWSSYNGFIDKLNIAFESTGADTTYNFEYDTVAPGASAVTPVPTFTNDTTPDYTFTTDEAATLTYGGSCSAATTAATVGSNTLTFDALADGTYSDCTVTLTDGGSNTVVLNVNAFTVDTVAPIQNSVDVIPLNGSVSVKLGTNENATVVLSYGPTNAYGSTGNVTTTASMSHDKAVLGLTPCTAYHYSVVSTDSAGNSSASPDGTFTTLGVGGCNTNNNSSQGGSPAPETTTSVSVSNNS